MAKSVALALTILYCNVFGHWFFEVDLQALPLIGSLR